MTGRPGPRRRPASLRQPQPIRRRQQRRWRSHPGGIHPVVAEGRSAGNTKLASPISVRQDRMAGVELSTCTTSARVVPSSSSATAARAPSVTCTLNCVCSGAHGDGRRQWTPSRMRCAIGRRALLFDGRERRGRQSTNVASDRHLPASPVRVLGGNADRPNPSSDQRRRELGISPILRRHPCGRARNLSLPSAQHGWLPNTATLQVNE